MFVHDFVSVERPALAVVDGFTRLQPSLGSIVLAAWNADRDLWTRLGITYPDYAPSWPIHLEIGHPRVRPDAVVIPLRWYSGDDEHRVALEADLEIAAFGSNVTHLHLLGRYAFPPTIERWSAEASRAHRATVSAVRRFLQMVAEELLDTVAAVDGAATDGNGNGNGAHTNGNGDGAHEDGAGVVSRSVAAGAR